MTAKVPIPDALSSRSFSIADGRAHGLGRRRMDGVDLSRPFHGVRATDEPLGVEALCRAYLPRLPPRAVFSGSTAAVMYGVPLPRSIETATAIHVTVPSGERAPRGRAVIGHARDLTGLRVWVKTGLPLTDPAWTWCDLATELALDDLIAAGDYLIHHRRGLATAESLQIAVGRLRGNRGVASLREAFELLDGRSESRKESHLRLLLVRGDIRSIQSNFWIALPGLSLRYRADFAIPELKVIIEYQGDHHRDPQQWRADMTRISRLEAHGWIVIQVNADDLRDPAELLARIRMVVARRSRTR